MTSIVFSVPLILNRVGFLESTHDRIETQYQEISSIPIPFISNQGQVDQEIKFYSSGSGSTTGITGYGIIYRYISGQDAPTEGEPWSSMYEENVFQEFFIDSFRNKIAFSLEGVEEVDSVISSFSGSDPSRWLTYIPSYRSVDLGSLWDGIHVEIHNTESRIEKLFVVEPGANPRLIAGSFAELESLNVSDEGGLEIQTSYGELEMTKPAAYQILDGVHHSIPVKYHIEGDVYSFQVASYDTSKPLYIDPIVESPTAATYIGSAASDSLYDGKVDVDASGNIIIVGRCAGNDFPTLPGSYQDDGIDGTDLVIAKFDPDLTDLLAATYYSGSDWDFPAGLAIDPSGDIIIAGDTYSSDLPVTAGSYDDEFYGPPVGWGNWHNGYVARFSGDLSTLEAATFISSEDGEEMDYIVDVVIDGNGDIVIYGSTQSGLWPTTPGSFDTVIGGGQDTFLTKFDPTLSTIEASTFFGGAGWDYSSSSDSTGDLELYEDGSFVIVGMTQSLGGFPVSPGAFQTCIDCGEGDPDDNRDEDGFVGRISNDLTTRIAATYLGADEFEAMSAIDFGIDGRICVAGFTESADYPTTDDAFQTVNSSTFSEDIVISCFNPTLTTLLASTYLGAGTGDDYAKKIAIDQYGKVYVTSDVAGNEYPETGDSEGQDFLGAGGGYAVFDQELTTLLYSNKVWIEDLIFQESEDGLTFATYTSSATVPTTSGAYDETPNGDSDIVVMNYRRDPWNPLVNRMTVTEQGDQVLLTGTAFDNYFGKYDEDVLGSSQYTGGGSAKTWKTDDAFWEYDFPFEFKFPLFGELYTKGYISSNGRVCFDSGSTLTTGELTDQTCGSFVAPFWGDITYPGGSNDIYITENDDNVTVMWDGVYSYDTAGGGFVGGGTAQGWHGDDTSWTYDLPFSFPFYGTSYDTVRINSNGQVCMGGTGSCGDMAPWYVCCPLDTEYEIRGESTDGPFVAPMWNDLRTDQGGGEDIYITENPDHVIIRWLAEDYTDGDVVNFEVMLYDDGKVVFNYGNHINNPFSTNANESVVGVSKDDLSTYTTSVYHWTKQFNQLASSEWTYNAGDDSYSETLSGDEAHTGDITAELVMYENGEMEFNYPQAYDYSGAIETPVVGVSNGDGVSIYESTISETNFLLTGAKSLFWHEIGNSPIVDVEYQVDSTEGAWTNCSPVDGSFNSVSEQFSCIVTAPEGVSSLFGAGDWAINVKATEAAGNSAVLAYDFGGELPPPPAPPPPGATPVAVVSVGGVTYTGVIVTTSDPTPTFTGTSAANASVTITISGPAGSVIGTTTADGSGNWSWTPGVGLGDGTYTVTITADDGAGGTDSENFTLIISAGAVSLLPVAGSEEEETGEEEEVEELPETSETEECPVIQEFAALPAEVEAGASTTVSWKVINADTVTIEKLGGNVTFNGRARVPIASDAEITLVAVKGDCERTALLSVTVLSGEAGEQWWLISYWWYYLLSLLIGAVSSLKLMGFSLANLPYYYQKYRLWVLYALGLKGKGEPWGVVYDSVTKEFLSRAVVRLYKDESLVDTRVTDVNGVFNLESEEGIYKLEVSRSGYFFPSDVIVGNTDGVRKNVYNGGEYEVESEKEPVRMYVPMDKEEQHAFDERFAKISSKVVEFLVLINPLTTVSGMILAVYYWTRDGDIIHVWIFLGYVVMLLVYVYGWVKERGSWGFVLDQDMKRLSGVEIGLYDPVYDRLVDTRVTDEKGRFRFVVVGGEYILRPVGSEYVIGESGYEAGYVVGHDKEEEQQVTERMVVRRTGKRGTDGGQKTT